MRAAVLLASVAVASCATPHSLQQVKTSNPSVTYEYRGDQELLQAQQNAVVFCSQYQSAPRPARFTTDSNGQSNNVVFDCDPSYATAAPRQQAFDPNLTYSYRTDQELLDASWNCPDLLHEQRVAAGGLEHTHQRGQVQDRGVPVHPSVTT
jgi:hypothetical protein